MWYWVKKIEGILLIPLLPVYVIYWKLRGIPFFFRCRQCRNPWLFLDLRYLRYGVCEECLQSMLTATPTESQKSIFEETAPPVIKPEFDWLFERVAKKVGEGKVLDVGCNTGYLLSKFNLLPELLFGVDIASKPIKIASNLIKRGNFCVADVRKLPFKSNTFDYLLCTEVLEHIIEGDEVAKECYRVLKPGGIALLIVPNGKGAAGKYMVPHIRFFTFKELINLLKEAGFEIVSGQKYGLYVPVVSTFSLMLSYMSGRKLPLDSFLWKIRMPEFLSVIFYIECRKPAQKTQVLN